MDTEGEYFQIGTVAERTGLSLKTIRHYDEVGLVAPSARSAGGFRLYTAADTDRLLVIRRMKPLGFTLEEMRRLLESLDVLEREGADEQQRSAAGDFLRTCRDKTRESAQRLRKHLEYAQEFADLLETRSGYHGE